ncbi:unnamed protein product (macronuclear) [Paramecium tetraurelia]|uniref:Uncharacterized protein n=1 Tax=Paramecium tetraurelia TaxID=5888 RepID=A0DB35_PARTE|nr:uncharacterized protein GSPATT00015146001 [Paramecium tetraurelia]CAK80252.1 unnamed protein product [Paramecium tetraurelia]|eukprot:XP_001447649.1 hypothetical protein (macronuclear) [Paramecium tetraurelia strain d4-2]
METSDSLDHLINVLEKLEGRYQDDQKEDDANNRLYQDQCDSDIGSLDKDIANSQYSILQLEAKLEGNLIPARSIQQGVEKAKLAEVKQYKQEIEELDEERKEQKEVYEAKIAEHFEASKIIREAQAIIKDGLQRPSLAEVKRSGKNAIRIAPNILAQVSSSLGGSINKIRQTHRFTKAYASIFKVLLTIMNKSESTADEGSVEKIIQLCSDLLAKIDDSTNLERFAEDKRVQAYEKHKHLLNRDLQSAESILANTQATLQSLNDSIQQAQNSISTIQQRLDYYQDTRQQRFVECEEAAYDYQQARSARDNNKQLVSDLIGLVNKHLRVLREQLALRVAAGDNI